MKQQRRHLSESPAYRAAMRPDLNDSEETQRLRERAAPRVAAAQHQRRVESDYKIRAVAFVPPATKAKTPSVPWLLRFADGFYELALSSLWRRFWTAFAVVWMLVVFVLVIFPRINTRIYGERYQRYQRGVSATQPTSIVA